jgi:hypothetical protein
MLQLTATETCSNGASNGFSLVVSLSSFHSLPFRCKKGAITIEFFSAGLFSTSLSRGLLLFEMPNATIGRESLLAVSPQKWDYHRSRSFAHVM